MKWLVSLVVFFVSLSVFAQQMQDVQFSCKTYKFPKVETVNVTMTFDPGFEGPVRITATEKGGIYFDQWLAVDEDNYHEIEDVGTNMTYMKLSNEEGTRVEIHSGLVPSMFARYGYNLETVFDFHLASGEDRKIINCKKKN